jgi:hypothetical protein
MTKTYATFGPEGLPTAFYRDDVYPPVIVWSQRPQNAPDDWMPEIVSQDINPAIPADAIEITEAQWLEFIENAGLRRWEDGSVVPYEPPAPPPMPIAIPVGVFFDRCTVLDADTIDEAMQAQPVKFRRAWQGATVFREDSDLWPVLRGVIVDLYGHERADELLAPATVMMRSEPA